MAATEVRASGVRAAVNDRLDGSGLDAATVVAVFATCTERFHGLSGGAGDR